MTDPLPALEPDRLVRRLAIAAALLVGASLVPALFGPTPALAGYLVGFAYWASLVLAALILLMIFHASHARWLVAARRPLEAMAGVVPVLALLFLPIALGLRHLYAWVEPTAAMGEEAREILAHKRAYLNVPFFLVRAAIYLLVAAVIGERLLRWSLRQDQTRALDLAARPRRLGAGGLPLMAIVFTFAAFDWLMSLTPLWYSTVFGVYLFAGGAVGAIAALIVWVVFGPGRLYGGAVSAEHLHNLGKLLFSFTCFWGYIAFSQLLLIWLANLPEEVPYYAARLRTGWRPITFLLGFAHFALPFAVLLSREVKRRPRALAAVAIWMLLARFVDVWWLVLPAFSPEAPLLPLSAALSVLGIGLALLAAAAWRLRGRSPVPAGDPALGESLAFRQP